MKDKERDELEEEEVEEEDTETSFEKFQNLGRKAAPTINLEGGRGKREVQHYSPDPGTTLRRQTPSASASTNRAALRSEQKRISRKNK